MRVRFKKNSELNSTMYEGTEHEFTHVSMGNGIYTSIKNTVSWSETPDGELVEADVPDAFMMSAVRYVEHKRGNEWITPKNNCKDDTVECYKCDTLNETQNVYCINCNTNL